MNKVAFLYSEELAQFNYGDDHPFKPIRSRNTMELSIRYGILYGIGVKKLEPKPCEAETLELFHEKEYLEILKKTSSGEFELSMLKRGIGTDDCPMVPNIYPYCLNVVGATLEGVNLVLDGDFQRAFNPIGGLHHGSRGHAEGFCYVNDVGVAIEYLLKQGKRVAFIDVDAHHCNGVEDAFKETDQVLNISLHETGDTLYPKTGYESDYGEGKGEGFSINVPLLEKTDDEVYWEAFTRIVPPAIKAFEPDFVIAEVGADTMISDPLTHLRLTTHCYYDVMKKITAISPKLLFLGGGGYDIFKTARCWTLALSALSEIEPEDDYAGLVGGMMYGADMDSLFDRRILTKGEDKENAVAHMEQVVKYIETRIFPIIGAKAE